MRPSNSSVDATSHLSLSDEVIASLKEFGTSWNMCTRISLMFNGDDPGCGCLCSLAFVWRSEYRGAMGVIGAGPASGKGMWGLLGACGVWGLGDLARWELGPNAVWCGEGGIVGGWARVTKSSPNESDSLLDSGDWWSLDGTGIDCVNFDSFAGK